MARESCISGQGEEIVTFAREELEHYLSLAGDTFQPPRIVVDKEYAKQCFPDETNGLKPDGFVIGKKNGEVMIGAINDRGLLYGVYEYIEHAVGIRFVDAPYGEVDTGVRDPQWPAETILENPTFPYRGGNMHMARSDVNF
ncbi:MAG: alpha-glucuronidase family glycosyl hydrolase [Clostridia bacterium]